jgi:hypothetical protein
MPLVHQKIQEIDTFMFRWIDKPSGSLQYGLSAQSLLQTFPEAVEEAFLPDPNNLENQESKLVIDSNQLTAILLKAIQELTDKVQQLEQKIEALS